MNTDRFDGERKHMIEGAKQSHIIGTQVQLYVNISNSFQVYGHGTVYYDH